MKPIIHLIKCYEGFLPDRDKGDSYLLFTHLSNGETSLPIHKLKEFKILAKIHGHTTIIRNVRQEELEEELDNDN